MPWGLQQGRRVVEGQAAMRLGELPQFGNRDAPEAISLGVLAWTGLEKSLEERGLGRVGEAGEIATELNKIFHIDKSAYFGTWKPYFTAVNPCNIPIHAKPLTIIFKPVTN
jgi:hypothetical protein